MSSTINYLMSSYGDDVYFEEGFLKILYTYIPLLRNRQITYQTPTNNLLVKYEGDLFGLLDNYNYGKQYFIPIMLFNNLRCSGDFNTAMTTIAIPDLAYIDLLYSTYISTTTTA